MGKKKKKKGTEGGEEEGSTTRAWIPLKVVSCREKKKKRGLDKEGVGYNASIGKSRVERRGRKIRRC